MLETTDVDNTPTELIYTLTVGPASGTIQRSGTGLTVGGTFTQDDVNAGRITYDHDGSEGTGDSFSFTVDDGMGSNTSGTFVFTITGLNDEQNVVVNTGVTVVEGAAGNSIAQAMLETIDSDNVPSELTYTLVTAPGSGTLRLGGTTIAASSLFTQADINSGSLTYDHDGSEGGGDSFSFQVDDGIGSTSAGIFAITVTPVNDYPNAAPDNYSTPQDEVLERSAPGLLANDTDVDSASLSAILVSAPTNGSLTLATDGAFTYTPNKGYSGTDSFVYAVSDGTLNSPATTVTITVATPLAAPIPDVPAEEPAEEDASTEEDATDSVEETLLIPSTSGVVPDPAVTEESARSRPAANSAKSFDGVPSRTNANGAIVDLEIEGAETAAELVGPSRTQNRVAQVRFGDDRIKLPAVSSALVGEFDEIRKEVTQDGLVTQAIAGSSLAVTTSLTAGYVVWLIRGGVLLSSVLSSMPAWQMIDPLPVLGYDGGVQQEEDDESLEALVAKGNKSRPKERP